MKVYAFIFARGGSKGIINKNLKKLNGISLLERNIMLIKKSKKIEKIFVSTDSEEIKKISENAGALVPVLRPKELAEDNSSEIDSWKFMVNYLKDNNDDFDVFISIPVVSPLKTLEDIDNCLDKFINEKAEFLMTVTDSNRSPYFNLVKEKDGYIDVFDKSLKDKANRQTFPKTYDLTTVAYIIKKDNINKLEGGVFNSDLKIIKYKVDKINGIDIDDINDFKKAEFFQKERIKEKVSFSVLDNIMIDEKICIVTGGMGHIGEKIVETFLELNGKVIIIDFENESTKERIETIENKFETKIDFYPVNLAKEEEINNFCQIINKKYPRVDVLVNCAALVGTSNLKGWAVPFEEQSSEAFDACMNINTKAPLLLIQGLLEAFKKSKNAKVISISSITSIRGNDFSVYEGTKMVSPIAYSISKSGLNIMTQYLASLCGEYNICFNSIVLGGIFRNQDEKFVSKYVKKTPLGRMGNEDDIKGIISFLSSGLSNYLTGQNIALDGGITCKI